jgi:hypothetical protein
MPNETTMTGERQVNDQPQDIPMPTGVPLSDAAIGEVADENENRVPVLTAPTAR